VVFGGLLGGREVVFPYHRAGWKGKRASQHFRRLESIQTGANRFLEDIELGLE
jgi:hypothetical protein